MIETINLLEPSADFLAPGDRIHQIDGVSTVGLTNDQVMNLLLCSREENAVIEIEYSLPDYREFDSMIDDRLGIYFRLLSPVKYRKTACASRRSWHR